MWATSTGKRRDRPKSATFTCKLLSRRMLLVFTSRCMMSEAGKYISVYGWLRAVRARAWLDKSSTRLSSSGLSNKLEHRRPGEESDSDYRDSSSDGSNDCELERGLKYSKGQWNHHLTNEVPLRMDRLSLRDNHIELQEGFSSDDGEGGNSQGHLLFEFLEQDPPYSHEPLADKISDLACCFLELKTLRSCDLLSSSWLSVAWWWKCTGSSGLPSQRGGWFALPFCKKNPTHSLVTAWAN